MKRPILRASFLSTNLSGSKFLTSAAKVTGKPVASKPWIGRHAAGAGQNLPPYLGSGVAHTAHQPQAGDYDSAVGAWVNAYLPPFAFFSM